MNGTAVFELTARDRKKLAELLALSADVRAVGLRTPSGEIELPAAAQRAAEQLLAELATDSSVRVLADDHELTTAQAGELLGLSQTLSSGSLMMAYYLRTTQAPIGDYEPRTCWRTHVNDNNVSTLSQQSLTAT